MALNSLEYVLFLLIVFVVFWALAGLRAVLRSGRDQRFRAEFRFSRLVHHATHLGEKLGFYLLGRWATLLSRTVFLLVASCVFYMSWNATFIFLMAGAALLDYGVALALGYVTSKPWRRVLLIVSLTGSLGQLALFKYFGFFTQGAHDIGALFGLDIPVPALDLILPVGISFYTFLTLSYVIDVYRGSLKPTKNFLEFATYVAFFPHLVAGPIVRAADFLPQFDLVPKISLDDVSNAVFLILRGMAKKVLIADYLAANWNDRVFDDPSAYGTLEVWTAAFAYNWQIYADFSGYTDIARGSARLFGFALPENFRRPYKSASPAEWWNRWHITLSTWIRDYIYIPLGGSRKGEIRAYVNILTAFFFSGIWHGAGWNFVMFGLWHGVTVAIATFLRKRYGDRFDFTGIRRWPLVFFNLLLFTFHWPIFRLSDMEDLANCYQQMFANDFAAFRVPPTVSILLVLVTVWHMTPDKLAEDLRLRFVRLPVLAQGAIMVAAAAVLAWIGSQQAAPFIYFQF
jgi:alginate O-acetyltransferase complex protein AlgI